MSDKQGDTMTKVEMTGLVKEIDSHPFDREAVPQALLDLEQRDRPSLFPWRGQFSPGFVEVMLANFAESDNVILDPFVGSGTTLFEAARRSMSCYGAEINPAAGELAKTVLFINVPPTRRQEYIKQAYGKVRKHLGGYLEPLPHYSRDTGESRSWEQSFKDLLNDTLDDVLVRNIVLNSVLRFYLTRGEKDPKGFLQASNQHKAIIEQLPYCKKRYKFFLCDARNIPLHVGTSHNGKRRMLCYNRSKGWDCPQKSALLEVYEYQIEQYLEMFHIPEDYQAKILEAHKKLQTAYDDTEKEQTRLKAQLERLKKLFAWGDLSEKQYLAEKENTLETLRALTPPETKSRVLEGLAEFLKNVAKAWREANQEHRNKLARQLFDEIWVKDKQVIAVKPRTQLKPFFQLSYEEWLKKFESENSTPLGVGCAIRPVTVPRTEGQRRA
jgi:hypothetical protein